jgi:TonB family protein
MAHDSIPGFDPAKPASSTGEGGVKNGVISATLDRSGESDLRELAAMLAAHGGGQVSPELSADLALQIVLNQIVEQACLATGAGGAAIVLKRGGEWVCRATAGGNAPQLGERLNTASGLSGACVKSRTVQRCDDAQNDPRADMEACRTLGVRSVIILPLLRNGVLAGVFELFSTSPGAFGERDERTLEALSRRVIGNLERASGPISSNAEPSKGAQPVAEKVIAASGPPPDRNQASIDRPLFQLASEASGRRTSLLTLALSAAVLAYAILLTVLVAQRLSGRKVSARAHASAVVSAPLVAAASQSSAAAGAATPLGSRNQSSEKSSPPRSATASGGSAGGASRAIDTTPPEGSLRIYENGREVFRMKPTAEQGEATSAGGTSPTEAKSADGTAVGTEVQRAAALEPAGTLQIPAEVAEGSLLHRVEPDYPEEARQQQIQGAVLLNVHISADGSVQEVTLVSGPLLLAQAATDAVKQWRFKPRLVNGHPAEMQTRITLNFRLP